ncbi:MAG: NUDIX domain-containing protein [Candidatus Micrarchaeota archaeon]|nr:NUDIX domain-containing protein [Candidatus Micrarchaeota archaeon]
MLHELKIRIKDRKDAEERLLLAGARFTRELNVTDTYFNQQDGRILKVTEDETGSYLVKLAASEGRFVIRKYERMQNPGEKKVELAEEFGIKCIIRKKRRFFELNNTVFNLNLIEDVGVFLIAEAENPRRDIFRNVLGLKNPEFVTVSFDELKLKKIKVMNAAKAIIIRDGKLLALKQSISGKEIWDLPGGRLKEGESPKEALIREVKEETGLSVRIEKPAGLWDFKRILDGAEVACITYICRAEGELSLQKDDPEEIISGYEWVSKDEFLKDEYVVGDKSLKDLISHVLISDC